MLMLRNWCQAGSGASAWLQVRIVKADGVSGLFRGAGPTVVRAMALNMGMLASNDQVTVFSCSPLRFDVVPKRMT